MFRDNQPGLIEPPAPAMPPGGMPGAPGPEGEIHLLDRLSVLYRYRKIVISVVTLVLLAGVVQTMTTTPEYEAMALLQIDADRALVPNLQSSMEQMYGNVDDAAYMATQISNIQSRVLIQQIVKPLDLANNPEFNGIDARPSGASAVLSSIKTRVMRPIESLFGRAPATPAPAPEIPAAPTPAVPAAPGAVPPAALAAEETEEESGLITAFLSHLTVEPRQQTRNVEVTFWSKDPKFAAKAAQKVAEAYVSQNLVFKKFSLESRRRLLHTEIAKMKTNVVSTQQAMVDFQVKNNATALADPQFFANQLESIRNAAQNKKIDKDMAFGNYDRLRKLDMTSAESEVLPAIANDGSVVSLMGQIQSLSNERKRLGVTFGEKADRMIQNQTMIDEVKAQLLSRKKTILETARLTYEMAVAQETGAAQMLKEAQERQGDLSQKSVSYGTITQRLDGDVKQLVDLESALREVEINSSSMDNNVRVADSASEPPAPYKPDRTRNMLISLMLGVGLAIVLAFGLDYLDDTVKTPEDITRKLRVPFLGLVPAVRGEKQPVLSGPVPHDFGEAYRALRTSLVFTSGGETTRIITVTSAQPLEGKTTTACNLAMVLAFGGSRVLLVDADMRRPGVHKALKMNNTVGLSHLLVGQARVREAIQRTSDPNFCVMTAGRTPPNPSELLSSERMKQLISNLKQGPFDWVVIDTPPVLAVTDAIILTPLVDGVTFVLGAEMTRRRLAERAVQMLMASRPKVMGAVLNRVNFDRNKYYYSRYYGYQYKSYYGSAGGSAPAKG